jgi:hypothetical protein
MADVQTAKRISHRATRALPCVDDLDKAIPLRVVTSRNRNARMEWLCCDLSRQEIVPTTARQLISTLESKEESPLGRNPCFV